MIDGCEAKWAWLTVTLLVKMSNNKTVKQDIYIPPLTGKQDQNRSGLQIEVAYRIAYSL